MVRGWGASTGSYATVVAPGEDAGWREVIGNAGPRGVIARGAGSGYGDAAQNAGGYVANSVRTVEFTIDDTNSTVAVDAGVLLLDLTAALTSSGWTLAVLPGTAHVTVGGAIAADVHGKNHPTAGSFGRQVASLDLLTAGGDIMQVGPDCHADVFWATVGGLGLTGIIRRARLRLRRIDTAWMWCRDSVHKDLDGILASLAAAHTLGVHAAAWVDGHASGGALGRGVVTTCRPARVDDLPVRLRSLPLAYPARRMLTIPPLPGRGVIRTPLVSAINAVHRVAARRHGKPALRSIGAALHPLDVTRGWAGLFGRRGLVQYQVAVPFGSETVLARILTDTVRGGCPAALVTIKQFGARNPAPLSFPGPGWTIALDFASVMPGIGRLLDAADDYVAAAGGRVYLVKDSRMRPELLPVMYPDVDRWRDIRSRLDPDNRLRSDLSRRLRLSDGK